MEWNGLRAEVIEREVKIKTMDCTCGSGTCKLAKNHKCSCRCGGAFHSESFKRRNRLSSLDQFEGVEDMRNLNDSQFIHDRGLEMRGL